MSGELAVLHKLYDSILNIPSPTTTWACYLAEVILPLPSFCAVMVTFPVDGSWTAASGTYLRGR